MSFKSIIVATCAYALMLVTSASYGAVTYVYTGQSYNFFSEPTSFDTSMSVSATIVLDAPLPANTVDFRPTPTFFSISDGQSTLTNAPTVGFAFIFSPVPTQTSRNGLSR